MAGRCYWEHTSEKNELYRCLDGELVCPKCCVHNCRRESPEQFARCAAAGHPTWPGATKVPSRKLVCLESYWDEEVFNGPSVRPFLEALRPLLNPPLQVGHRFVEGKRGLSYYTKYPSGLLWGSPETFDSPIYYMAFHRSPGSVHSVLDQIGPEQLCTAFSDFGRCGYDVIVYFGACSVFRGREGQKFAQEFMRASGCKAILGYATDIDWMDSLIADILFLHRFYSDTSPWKNLEKIQKSVLSDFTPARKMGLLIFQ
jgi:hypothetical protein